MKHKPRFGEKGQVGVEFIGALPFEHRGACSGVNYVWNQRRNNVWVDKRDLPELAKAAGRENLKADDFAEPKPKQKAEPKKLGEMTYGEQNEEVANA